MTSRLLPRERLGPLLIAALTLALLLGAYLLGGRANTRLITLLAAPVVGLVLLTRPVLGLPLLVIVALVMPVAIPTGTEVTLNFAALLVPALFAIWLAGMVVRRQGGFAPSRANRPLLLFLLAGVLSLAIGNLLWDPAVPKAQRFALVQWAQWGIFAFSAGAFWLGANLIRDETGLRRLTWIFLWLGGGLAILRQIPGLGGLLEPITTVAFIRAPFWVLLAGLAGGQVLFNRDLGRGRRAYCWLLLGVVVYYAFFAQREAASNWVGVAAVLGVLAWLRFPRLRWPAVALLVALIMIGILFPTVYEFAGGDREWILSGGSRLALIERVISVTMRNPLTGLGPASYRPYAGLEPLRYRGALWLAPSVNSHNNYVDLFAHGGLLGLGLFLWFALALALHGWRLSQRPGQTPFVHGYVAGLLATWAGALVIMLLADWMLPFVYNIGFPGFQASVLVWLFLGGLVAIERMPEATP